MSIEQELAARGFRLAANCELGYFVTIESGHKVWANADCTVLGTSWQICGASGDGPCMCDVWVVAGTDAGEGK